MRELTEAARCAKLIREDLKKAFPQIKFKVTSSNYSMGNSVDIDYTDGVESDKIKAIILKYEDGYFNGMDDSYNHYKNPDNIPRAKYIHVNREISEQVKAQLLKELNITDLNAWNDEYRCWNSSVLWQNFHNKDFPVNNFIEVTA